ncbi:MAG TPA: M20/M25/M40 family metallo-hydrolase, partial [Thermoanaerobaculia bacterium]|nr:M20/M25/M40 family metallo-hydrolase [Thermoanaerobaculia bacterium]
ARLAERILLPALNVRGLEAGRVGAAAANAIPTVARASIDFRLVPDQTPEEVRRLVEQHFVGLGWHLLHEEPDLATRLAHPKLLRLDWEGGYRAVRTPLDLPLSRAVLAVASHAAGEKVLAVPMLGGSLPLYHFEDVLHAPLVIVPIVNHDNNQHAANENLRLANLWQGIDLFAALLAELGGAWEGSP